MMSYDKLDEALDAFDKRKKETEIAAAVKGNAQELFMNKFATFRDTTAHAVLDHLGAHLSARGHEFELVTDSTDRREDKHGGFIVASISLVIYPAGSGGLSANYGKRGSMPKFTIRGDASSQKVMFEGTVVTGKMAVTDAIGGRGVYALSDVTADLIREKAIECISASFK